jgi:hypothetical protein
MEKPANVLDLTITGAALLAAAAAISLAGCGGKREAPAAAPPAVAGDLASARAAAPPEMAWARAALERNPNLEVMAADPSTGVFTVRDRASGEIRTARVAELAAVPVALLAEAAPEEAVAAEPAAQVSPEEAAAAAEPALNYTVERTGGQVRVSGPGVSIVSATGPAAATAAAETGPRTVDPIICDGERVMQVNDRRVVVTGDAITAKNGCQLHITNSRVTATGTAVVIRDATVHITNSTVEGGTASFDAGPGAKVFLQGATMKGTTRRDEDAEVHEQGNNQWQ